MPIWRTHSTRDTAKICLKLKSRTSFTWNGLFANRSIGLMSTYYSFWVEFVVSLYNNLFPSPLYVCVFVSQKKMMRHFFFLIIWLWEIHSFAKFFLHFFLREFQLIASTLDDKSLSSDQDINQFFCINEDCISNLLFNHQRLYQLS